MRFTFNINLSEAGDFEKLLRTLQAWKPPFVVCMNGIGGNEYGRVKSTIAAWGGKIIYRHYEQSDGHLWRTRTATEHINLLKSLKNLDPNAWFYVLNEPLPDNSERDTMQKWCADVIRLASENNIRLCMGNLAVAAMDAAKADVDSGRWDVLLRAIGEQGQRKVDGFNLIMLGVHTYTHAVAPKHCAGQNPNDLVDPTKVGVWPTPAQVYETPEDNWLFFREDWYVQRIKTLTGNLVDTAVTETLWDRMPNIVKDFPATTANIDRMAGREVKGLPTLTEYYRAMFPQWTPAKTACEQMAWAEGVYPENYRAFALFTWSQNRDWKDGYDLSGMDEFLQLWPTYGTPPPPDPEPQPDAFEAYAIRGLEFANVRSATIVHPGNWLGRLTNGERCAVLETDISGQDGNLWARIRKTDGLEGYVSQTVISFQPLTVNAAPPEDVVLIDKESYDELVSQAEALESLIARGMMEIGAAVDEIFTPVARSAREHTLAMESEQE